MSFSEKGGKMRFVAVAAVTLLGVALGSGEVLAQAAPSPFSVERPAGARSPAADPRAQGLAAELVRLVDIQAAFSSFMAQNLRLVSFIVRDNPSADPFAVQTMVEGSVQKAFLAQVKQIEAQAVSLYAQRFSVAELQQIVDFYKSPAGEKVLSETPAILKELTVEHPWNGVYGMEENAKANVTDALRKAGLRIPKEFHYR